MHKILFIFMLFVGASLGHASVGWDFTAPSGEDTAMIIDGGGSSEGLVVGRDQNLNQAITGIGLNSGKGVLGSDATGLIADGYHSYPAIIANQHGTSVGISAGGYSHGVVGEATGPNDPVGVAGHAYSGLYPTGVKGTSTTNTAYAYHAGVTATGTTGTAAMNTWGVRAHGQGSNKISPNDNAVGVYATASGAGGLNYGVYAEGTTYAGYFNGSVNVTGTCNCYPSDEKLKKDVKPLDKGLETIMALAPKSYVMKVDEYKGKLELAKGPQLGMIAQDVEKIAPELVTKVLVPPREVKGENGKMETAPSMEYKTLNYVGLIPVLIKAMQEQEAKIEALERKLAAQ